MKKIALILIILIGIGLIVVFMDNSKKEENNQQTQPVINEQNNQVTPKEENNQQAQPVQEPQKEENKQNIQDNQSVPTEQIEEKKPKTKVEKLKDLSSKVDAKAQNELGDIYANGSSGVKQSYKEALRLFKQSANSGNSQAQYNLGTMYQNAIGVEQDFKKAVKYYKLAAKQGHKEAKENLKMLCEQDSTLCK